MKIFHISDLHIGKHLHFYSLAQEQRAILNQIVEKTKEYRPDVIVIAGDIYDKSVPSGEAYRIFDDFLVQLSEITPSIPVLIIAGNHDSPERLQYAASFLEKHHIYISTMPPRNEEEHLRRVTLQDEAGEVDFYLFPFTKPGYVRQLFPEGTELNYEKAFAGVLAREEIDWNRRNVLVAHQFFTTNGQQPQMCDSETTGVVVGGLDAIDTSVISGFDYVALGHIHGPQTIGNGRIRYCGTPLKYSVSEEHHNKSITMVTLEEKGNEPVIETIPLNCDRDVRKIKGTLQELLQAGNEQNCHDYVSITLTDEKEPYRPKDTLEEVYDHILEITVDNMRTRALLSGQEGEIETLPSPMEAFREFYQIMQQQPLSEEEEAVIQEILVKIGGETE